MPWARPPPPLHPLCTFPLLLPLPCCCASGPPSRGRAAPTAAFLQSPRQSRSTAVARSPILALARNPSPPAPPAPSAPCLSQLRGALSLHRFTASTVAPPLPAHAFSPHRRNPKRLTNHLSPPVTHLLVARGGVVCVCACVAKSSRQVRAAQGAGEEPAAQKESGAGERAKEAARLSGREQFGCLRVGQCVQGAGHWRPHQTPHGGQAGAPATRYARCPTQLRYTHSRGCCSSCTSRSS